MQVSNYFQGALSAYQAELQDLASHGENQFKENIAIKLSSLDTLMSMAADFPEMVAPIFHGSIKFTDLTNIKTLVTQDLDSLPTWESLKLGVIFADQELINKVLTYENGEFLLIFSVAMEFLFKQKPATTKKKPPKNNGSPDVDGDWNYGEAPNLTGLDIIDSPEGLVMNTGLIISQATTLVVAGAPFEAEKALVAFAEKHGDKELRVILDEMEPKHLSAIVREFDCSKSSPINSLVNVEQFMSILLLERHYNELSKLESLINSIVMTRDELERYDFLIAISEAGCEDILATYLLGSGGQNYELLAHFHCYNTFNLGWENPDSHVEASDGEWKQFAFELRESFPDSWDTVYECVQRVYTKIMQAGKVAQNEQEDRLIKEFDQFENKNQDPIIAKQASENSAL